MRGAPQEAPGPVLVSRLALDQEPWRVQAEDALVGLGPAAVPLLVGAARHASPLVRFHAVRALGRIASNCRNRNWPHVSISSGSGVRLPGGRHLTTLQI